MKKTGDAKFIQELNQSIVLNMIRREGPISRSEIAKKTKLSPTTVATVVSELVSNELAIDGTAGKSSGGRRPVLVKFNPDKKFLIGVSIANSSITVAKMNLNAAVKDKVVYPVDFSINKTDVIESIVEIIKKYVNERENLSPCVGISIITPGIVDSEKGIIRYNSKLNLHDVLLKAIVEERVGIETWVENDANAIVLAEKQFGAYRHKNNLFYMQLRDGLGSGVIVNNSIFRGSKGGAGEFGHISIDRGGIKCDCGNTGCLENYVGWPAIYSRIVSSLSRGKQSLMLELAGGDIGKVDQKTFKQALERGDLLANSIAEETIAYLITGIVNIVNLFNPEVILIGWEIIHDNSLFMEKIKKEVKEKTFTMFANDLEIEPTTLGENFELKGAAAVLLTELFDFSLF